MGALGSYPHPLRRVSLGWGQVASLTLLPKHSSSPQDTSLLFPLASGIFQNFPKATKISMDDMLAVPSWGLMFPEQRSNPGLLMSLWPKISHSWTTRPQWSVS